MEWFGSSWQAAPLIFSGMRQEKVLHARASSMKFMMMISGGVNRIGDHGSLMEYCLHTAR